MRLFKAIFAVSICLNVLFLAFSYIRYDSNEEALNHAATMVMHDFIELESAIDYQIKMNWVDESVILEKIEDILENLHMIEVYGSQSDLIDKQSNKELIAIAHVLSRYPEYTGFPNAQLTEKERKAFIQLRDKLRRAGLGMNMSFTGGWDNFLVFMKRIIEE
ncbi:hypothetical protein [Paenibacillus arenosi]|uniref:Uncharacterized protein n=1 Tax=Paenibacillus arenosi TaxID=2774142 RepID=A0ABR9B4D3_9BACL|nr:hypothetical protein [Paenibacillus arenosi]MBD8501235.1 hypothetical protein [Paenibacillus arenosi]